MDMKNFLIGFATAGMIAVLWAQVIKKAQQQTAASLVAQKPEVKFI